MDKYLKYLLLIFLVLNILLLTPRIIGNDGIGYYVYLRSMVIDHDLDFTNEFSHYGDQYVIVGHSQLTGRPVNGVPIGSAILWLPFFLAAHLFTLLIHSMGSSIPADGYSFPYVLSICFASSLYGFLGICLLYKLAKRFFTDIVAFWSVLLIWLCSPLVFYMYLHPSMAHANSFFAVTLFLYLLSRIYFDNQRKTKNWIILGLAAGLMTIIRLQDVLFLLVPIICLTVGKGNRSSLLGFPAVACFGMAFLIALFPELYSWYSIFGSFMSGPQSHALGANLNLLHPQILHVLFSGRHGLILWNPIILLGLLGIDYFYKKESTWTGSLLIVFFLQLWVVGSWREWWGAHSFGHRMFLTSLPLFAFGLAGWIDKLFANKYQKYVYSLGILLILWNFGLMFQYALNLINRDGTTPFLQVIQNQFLVVPTQLVGNFTHLFFSRIP